MGTPEFARASLQALLDAGHEICGVFTRPDAPRGRGMKLTPPPVKDLALERDIPVYQPTKLRDGTALELIQKLAPELIAVVAYGRLLPEEILTAAPLGCINVHGSLLPKYRGAAPVQWAVAKGESVTGVTTMYLAPEMDTGDMIFTDSTPISPTDTGSTVYDRLADMGGRLLVKTVAALADGIAPRIPQEHSQATYAPPVTKEDMRIDWSRPAAEIDCHIRAFSPMAWTMSGEMRIRILEAKLTDGKLEILRVQASGGKPMPLADYLRGHNLSVLDVL